MLRTSLCLVRLRFCVCVEGRQYYNSACLQKFRKTGPVYIKIEKSAKFLGVISDPRLSWKPHYRICYCQVQKPYESDVSSVWLPLGSFEKSSTSYLQVSY